MTRWSWLVLFALVSTRPAAGAEPEHTLRLAAIIPDGSAWAHEIRAFARRVEDATGHSLRMKVHLSAVAGDEEEELEHLRRGDLDLVASGGALCERVAPSMRIMRVPSVFQERGETREVFNRLFPAFVDEAHQRGFVLLGASAMGADVFFTRAPVHNMQQLRKLRLWRWVHDDASVTAYRDMGLNIVPMRFFEATAAYDEGRIDGFITIPTAALAFQWSARARYVEDLRTNYVVGCLVATAKMFDSLTIRQQTALRDAVAVFRVHAYDLERDIDDALLGGLFQKQGVTPVAISQQFRFEFFDAARKAREHVAERFVSKALLDRVLQILVDYRAEHPN